MDFRLWGIVVLLCKRGFFFFFLSSFERKEKEKKNSYSQSGRELLALIGQNINDNRYSTPKRGKMAPLLSRSDIEEVFQLKPPIQNDFLNWKPHQALVRAFLGTKARKVDVFKDDVLVEGSPFPSFKAAQRALGWNPDQVIIGRFPFLTKRKKYIDTYKAYKRKGEEGSFIFKSPSQATPTEN